MAIKVTVHAAGLLHYAKAGKEAVQKIRKAMSRVLNAGRTAARRRISADFGVRTGLLRRKSRSMQAKVTVKASAITGKVTPLPRVLNIFESGATLSHGRGLLRPRPVVAPAQATMNEAARTELHTVLAEVGK